MTSAIRNEDFNVLFGGEMKSTSYTLSMSSALRQLLIHCHTSCSVDCCRANAFQISETMISRWLAFERVDRTGELAEEIGRIKEMLRQKEGKVILSARGLDSEWRVDEFKIFWDRLEAAFVSALVFRK